VDYRPYTVEHVVTQLQLLMFSALAFTVLMRKGLYPPELRSTNLDFDWLYRVPGRGLLVGLEKARIWAWGGIRETGLRGIRDLTDLLRVHHAPGGLFARSWSSGEITLWTAVLLAAFLILSYMAR
jgi:multicomponent Na+:H+ antiporter subunit D